jgi:hypothetical protein
VAWQAFTVPGIVIAAATPEDFLMVHTSGWNHPLGDFDPGDAVDAIADAIAADVSKERARRLALALSVVLGAEGCRRQSLEGEVIARTGNQPV